MEGEFDNVLVRHRHQNQYANAEEVMDGRLDDWDRPWETLGNH